ncbi:hypothetical protein KPL71_025922 [Citrus sinensis]|uniref:Uncharacterized protein n=1 Tax=Citrus sinensis TaxID=2711 RepID=A0ACB8HWJ5_CITSI|nr:hypothetical protein KPL71_025922 [Citrus sinensis]
MARVPYSSAIGSLMYAIMCTRPDICYDMGLVSKYQSNSGRKHWNAVKRIVAYLKGTADYSLCCQGGELHLIGYIDADGDGDLNERKSTSGYVFLLSRSVISWSSKKQTCVDLSTIEAEYVACSAAVQEAVWLKRFTEDLKIVTDSSRLVIIHCYSQATISFTKDAKYHSKSKHIETQYNFVREIVAQEKC